MITTRSQLFLVSTEELLAGVDDTELSKSIPHNKSALTILFCAWEDRYRSTCYAWASKCPVIHVTIVSLPGSVYLSTWTLARRLIIEDDVFTSSICVGFHVVYS